MFCVLWQTLKFNTCQDFKNESCYIIMKHFPCKKLNEARNISSARNQMVFYMTPSVEPIMSKTQSISLSIFASVFTIKSWFISLHFMEEGEKMEVVLTLMLAERHLRWFGMTEWIYRKTGEVKVLEDKSDILLFPIREGFFDFLFWVIFLYAKINRSIIVHDQKNIHCLDVCFSFKVHPLPNLI